MFVGKDIGVRVGCVAEGSGVGVAVGTTEGVVEVISPNPPHAIKKKVVLDMKSKNLLMIISQRRFDYGALSANWAL